MILYNVTVSIDPSAHEEWTKWMREVHIPDVLATGCFLESRLSRIQGEEEGGMTFSVMYLSPSQEMFDKYQAEFAPKLQAEHAQLFLGRFAAFRTILNVVEEFRYVG